MQVTITLSGPQGSGKTVLAEFIQRQLGSHVGLTVERELGSQDSHMSPDRLTVETSPLALSRIAASK